MKSLISFGGSSCVLVVALGLAWANQGLAQLTQDGGLPGGGGQQPATATTGPSRTTSAGGRSGGQSEAPRAGVGQYSPADSTSYGYVTGFDPNFPGAFPGTPNAHYSRDNAKNDELNSALASWRDSADDAGARQSAKEKANQALATIYDELLNSQEQEIDALEKRVVELREQLGRRRQAKIKMVELKLEMLLSQTDGLGWPSSEPQSTRYRDRLLTSPAIAPFGVKVPGVTSDGPAILPGTGGLAPAGAPVRQ